MKKFLLFAVSVILVFSLSACGGTHNASKIQVQDSITKQFISIPVAVKNVYDSAGYYATFSISSDLSDLSQTLSAKIDNVDFSVNIYQNKYIVLQAKDSCFIVGEIEENSEDQKNSHRYLICSPTAEFNVSNSNQVRMYMPYHLLEITTFVDINFNNSIGDNTVKFETSSTIDDISNFYASFNRYNVTEQGNTITVTDKGSGNSMLITLSQGQVTFTISD